MIVVVGIMEIVVAVKELEHIFTQRELLGQNKIFEISTRTSRVDLSSFLFLPEYRRAQDAQSLHPRKLAEPARIESWTVLYSRNKPGFAAAC